MPDAILYQQYIRLYSQDNFFKKVAALIWKRVHRILPSHDFHQDFQSMNQLVKLFESKCSALAWKAR